MLQVTMPSAEHYKNKFWIKELSSINSPVKNGFDYEGSFCDAGKLAEIEAPGMLYMYMEETRSDYTAVLFTFLPNLAGDKGVRVKLSEVTGGGWAVSLAKKARELIAMTPEQRMALAAPIHLAAPREKPLTEAVQAHYRALIISETKEDARAKAIARIREMMSEYDITAIDLA